MAKKKAKKAIWKFDITSWISEGMAPQGEDFEADLSQLSICTSLIVQFSKIHIARDWSILVEVFGHSFGDGNSQSNKL